MTAQLRVVNLDRAADEADAIVAPALVRMSQFSAEVQNREAEQRESALVQAYQHALATVTRTQSVTVKAQIVRDMGALRAMAQAYRMSEPTRRRAAEASVMCQRSFGQSVLEALPKASNWDRSQRTGVDDLVVAQSVKLAKASENDLDMIFVAMEMERLIVTAPKVLERSSCWTRCI
jgi:hypothetical protein